MKLGYQLSAERKSKDGEVMLCFYFFCMDDVELIHQELEREFGKHEIIALIPFYYNE